MFIYNVTVNIAEEAHHEWLHWMKETHIPDVMRTGCFTGNRMLKVLRAEDEGHTYSMQYLFEEMTDLERYQEKHAPALQSEHKAKFDGKFVAFRTLLEEVM